MRVVSLVPSLTELVWAFRPEVLAGRTRFCTVPAEVRVAPAFGGTKNPDVAGIIALAPDLVIANKEENRREDIEALKGAGVRVMLTDPNTVDEALAMILEIGQLLGASTRAEAMVADASEALREPGLPGTRVFVPVWREPLMGLGSGTYGSDLLERCGAVNVLRGRTRYPQMEARDVRALAPDAILLPDEPYRFGLKHLREFEALAPLVLRVPGEWLWWYGPRIGSSVRALRRRISGMGRPSVRVVRPEAFAAAAADLVIGLAKEFESPVIGLPTGKTPVSFYEELTNRVREGTLDISSCRPFAIDEYIGNPANPGSNRGYFARYWDTIPGAPAVTEFDGGSAAPEEEGGRLAEALNAVGGLDVAVLGIGMNGHIAFNEPGSGTEASTRLVELAEESRAAAEEAWGGESPVQGLTLGMKELRSARTVVVLANGRHKAAIVRRAIEGEASPEVPASLLQGHPELSWLLDESAAEELGAQAR